MLKCTIPPETDPVLWTDAKRHLIVDHDEDNDRIAEMVSAATKMVEALTARQLLTATWTLYADRFDPLMELRVCPVQSIVEVRYVDSAGEQQTLDESAYLLDAVSEPARLVPAPGTSWPATQRRINAVEIEFLAGYGDRFAVPETAKQAINLLAGHWFANREAVGTVGSEIALAFTSLVYSLRWTL